MQLKKGKGRSRHQTSTNDDQPRKTKKKSGIAKIYHRKLKSRGHTNTKQDDNQNSTYPHEDDDTSTFNNSDEQEECGVNESKHSECDDLVNNNIPKGNIQQASFFSAQSEMSIIHSSCSGDRRLRSADSSQSPTILQSDLPITCRCPFYSVLLNENPVPEILKRDKLSERKWLSLKDDPTIEESLECVFLHQLQNESGNVEEAIRESNSDEDCHLIKEDHNLINEYLPPTYCDNFNCLNPMSINENHGGWNGSSCIVHIESYVTLENETKNLTIDGNDPVVDDKRLASPEIHKRVCCQSCIDCKSQVPSLFPSQWPQSPILLRPTPGSGTRVKGVRFADSSDYLKSTDPGGTDKMWSSLKPSPDLVMNLEGTQIIQPTECCPECCDTPINNGKEDVGRSVVVDFESPLFMGTMHVRVRGSYETIKKGNNRADYFKGVNRHYQVIVRGCFKKDGIPMIECVSGQVFDRPLKLPAPYILKGVVKVLKFFSPRLQAKLNGDKPYLLSPLGSTPQTVNVDAIVDNVGGYKADVTISETHEEPCTASRQLVPLSTKSTSTSSTGRAKDRKKAFDKMCASGNKSVTFQKDKVYTFEFLQHLFNPEKFELNLGKIGGSYKLDKFLDGQCLNIMAAHQRYPLEGEIIHNQKLVNNSILDTLWSFDLWHENLLDPGSRAS